MRRWPQRFLYCRVLGDLFHSSNHKCEACQLYLHYTSLLKVNAKVNSSAAEMFNSWISKREALMHLSIPNAIHTHTGHCLVFNERVRQKMVAEETKFKQGGAFKSTLAALRKSGGGMASLVPQRSGELPQQVECTPYAPRREVSIKPPLVPAIDKAAADAPAADAPAAAVEGKKKARVFEQNLLIYVAKHPLYPVHPAAMDFIFHQFVFSNIPQVPLARYGGVVVASGEQAKAMVSKGDSTLVAPVFATHKHSLFPPILAFSTEKDGIILFATVSLPSLKVHAVQLVTQAAGDVPKQQNKFKLQTLIDNTVTTVREAAGVEWKGGEANPPPTHATIIFKSDCHLNCWVSDSVAALASNVRHVLPYDSKASW